MRYYSEETVKKIMQEVEVKEIQCNIYDNLYSDRIYPNLDNFESIELAEPHGRLIDAEELVKKYKDKCWEKLIMLFVSNAPTILEASK